MSPTNECDSRLPFVAVDYSPIALLTSSYEASLRSFARFSHFAVQRLGWVLIPRDGRLFAGKSSIATADGLVLHLQFTAYHVPPFIQRAMAGRASFSIQDLLGLRDAPHKKPLEDERRQQGSSPKLEIAIEIGTSGGRPSQAAPTLSAPAASPARRPAKKSRKRRRKLDAGGSVGEDSPSSESDGNKLSSISYSGYIIKYPVHNGNMLVCYYILLWVRPAPGRQRSPLTKPRAQNIKHYSCVFLAITIHRFSILILVYRRARFLWELILQQSAEIQAPAHCVHHSAAAGPRVRVSSVPISGQLRPRADLQVHWRRRG